MSFTADALESEFLDAVDALRNIERAFNATGVPDVVIRRGRTYKREEVLERLVTTSDTLAYVGMFLRQNAKNEYLRDQDRC